MSGLIISVIILSAQTKHENKGIGEQNLNDSDSNANKQIVDTIPVIDNTEGLTQLNKIIARYQNAELAVSGEIYYYGNIDSTTVPEEKSVFNSVITSKNSSYEIDSVQTIVDGTITLIVDKKDKSMAVFEQEPELKNNPINNDVANQLKEFLGYIHSIEVKNENSNKSLVIVFNDDIPSNINKYQIFYDADSYRIKKIRMEMTDGEITDSNDGGDSGESEEKSMDELVFVDSTNNEIPTGYYANLKTTAYEIVYKHEKPADPMAVDISKFVRKTDEGYTPVGIFRNYELQN